MQKKLNHMFSFFSPFQKWRTQQSLNHVFFIDIGHRTKGIKWVTIHLHSKYAWIMSIAILQLIIEKSSAKLRFWFCMAAYYSLASKRQRELELWFLSLQEVNGLGFTLVQWVGSYMIEKIWLNGFISFSSYVFSTTEQNAQKGFSFVTPHNLFLLWIEHEELFSWWLFMHLT